uniref:FAD-binding protein n=1 Tax=candidate division WOR-3 bacterium TaxID=2052148 RepID=A0A7C4UAA4_UNCW3
MRIGVFICHCGLNIAGTIDVKKVAEEAKKIKDVVFSTNYIYMCSEPGQQLFIDTIRDYNLDGAVVANCSPTLHERTFRNAAIRAGINPYKVEIANIREQISWPHMDEPEIATRKALRVIETVVEKLRRNISLRLNKVPITKRALVIGGGIAGIQSALDIADGGYEVVLVEKEPTIGGKMILLSETFPTLDCPQCIETPKMTDVGQHPNIKLYTYSEIENISGYIGNFDVKIKRKTAYVDYSKCKGCADCAEVCPVLIPDSYNGFLSLRKAIYRPFAQAVPNVFTIEKKGTPPCKATCPAHLNVQGYVAATRAGRFDQGIKIIREESRFPFAGIAGRICTHPCERECDRKNVDDSVSIKYIKRFLADWEWKTKNKIDASFEIKEERKEKITIIGAGPSGLTAAFDLRLEGFQVEVIDKLPEPGGLLLTGIPSYRLPKDVLKREIDFIKSTGVKFRMNTEVGKDISFKEILENSDAVFIGAGAHKEMKMGIEGEEIEGVIGALHFLKKVNLGEDIELGENVFVVGGGNSAIDAARTTLRLGKKVKIVYRRSIEEMPAIKDEVEAAIEEGIEILFLTNPVRFIGENNKLKGMELIKMRLGEPDSSGRRRPIPVEGSNYIVDCDNVILAIGEKPELSFLGDVDIKKTEWGSILTDEITLQTSIPKVFAGGDVSRGPATFIDAVGDGRRAAESIKKFLNKEDLYENREFLPPFKSDLKGYREIAEKIDRKKIPSLPVNERINNFKEVETGFNEEQIIEEAKRCINCGGCSECKLCIEKCEPKAIDHNRKDEIVEEKVGAIIVATGFELLPIKELPEYGGGKIKDVIDGLQFERLLCASGPTAGVPKRPSDGKIPESVAFISCAGSRDPAHNLAYCSRVCCMYLAKQAMLYKHQVHNGKAYIFYIDIRSNGKGYEEFVQRAKEEEEVLYIRGKVSKIYEKNGKVVILGVDTLLGERIQLEVDMVVLGTAMIPSSGARELAKKLRIQTDEYGWLKEVHLKLRPLETSTSGIFIAGVSQYPKDITDTVSHASGAASKVLSLFSKDEYLREPIIASVDTDVCSGCGICESICPYSAITIDKRKKVSVVNEAICEGCGACSAGCPSGAITLKNLTKSQVFDMVHIITGDY